MPGTRATTPHVPADDAVIIDTTDLTIDRDAPGRPRCRGAPGAGAALVSAPAASPRIAVVGRQNVGKSTLANRLFGRREAIAHDMPGVTRDRVELEAVWRGKRFGLVDTAGYVQRCHRRRRARARASRHRDAGGRPHPADRRRAGRRSPKRMPRSPVGSAARAFPCWSSRTRSTVPRRNPTPRRSTRWGWGNRSRCRACTGAPPAICSTASSNCCPMPRRCARTTTSSRGSRWSGRPNVGKSSLFNRLLGEERSVVFEEAGTTRDSVDDVVEWPTGRVRFVDTAGMRRQVKVKGVEYFSFVRATEAIDRANVVILVIDAVEGFTVEDKKIANRVMDAGRAFVLVANKWDLVEEKDARYQELAETVRPFANATVMRASAKTGRGVHRLPPVLLDLHERWTSRISTSKVNEVIQQAQRERPTPRVAGHPPLRDAGRHRAAVVRDLRWRQRAGRHLSALPREPPAPNLRSRRGSDPAEVPAPQATQQAALRRPSVRPVQSPLRAVAQLG